MTERDRTSGGRRRPTYGLPGPVPDQDGSTAHTPSSAREPGGAGDRPGPVGRFDAAASGADASPGAVASAPDAATRAPGGAPAPPRKRRGIVPLVIGLVLLIVIAPVVAIGGVVWSLGSLVSDQASGPEVLSSGSEQVSISANEMIIVYVPSEDASQTTCTATATDQGAITVVPTSGSVTFGDGSTYEQTIGVAAGSDATVTVDCEGTDAPAYLGPYSLFSVAGPLLIGPVIGVLAGLAGLVLVVVGIVKLVQSRRP